MLNKPHSELDFETKQLSEVHDFEVEHWTLKILQAKLWQFWGI